MATINGVEVAGDKSAHDFRLLDDSDKTEIENNIERNREATEDNHEDIVRHRTDTDVHVTPEWKNSLVSKETLGLYWTAAQTADIINEISIAGGAKLVKVDELPETGKEQTIYLVPKTDPLERDIFDEFVWIDGKFEFIGTTKVDLSNYATKTELNAKQDALSNQQIQNIADVANKANDSNVVHRSGDETIDGVKTFSNIPIVVNGRTYVSQINADRINGVKTGFSANNGFKIVCDKNSDAWNNTAFAIHMPDYSPTSCTVGFKLFDCIENSTSYKGFLFRKDGDNLQLSPTASKLIDLGSPTNLWKTINGINPGALSLPNTTGLINVASSITGLDGITQNKFTPQVDGWLHINGTGAANDGFIYVTQGRIGMMSANNPAMLRCVVLIPVVAGAEVTVTCKLNSLTWANITPCQGNV